jgi:aromatic-L-amino-acid decarboxylase
VNNALDFTAEQMRVMGYRVIDLLAEHLSTLSDSRVGAKGDPEELLAKFSGPPPELGVDFESVLAEVAREVLPNTMHVNHPRFFAYVPGPGNFVGAMADALAAGFNVFAGTWIGGSGAAAVEAQTIAWLCDMCGFPPSAGGLFLSGGTLANLTGVAVARHVKLGEEFGRAVLYYSDQVHSSVEKDLRLLGFARRRMRKIESDEAYRLSPAALERAIAQDRAAGLQPFCVAASAGTTNTGALDPLPELSALCRREDMWLHVDGAYGAAAVICGRGKALLGGLELADSLSLDPHKWLFQPFECGCVLTREASHLTDTFEVRPEYLQDTHRVSAEINYADRGPQLTRSFRALKLWMSIRVFGVAAFRQAIEKGFELAEFAEEVIRKMNRWEVVTPAQMGIVTFRFTPADDALHLRLVQRLLEDGHALITSTVLRGRTVLRMCTINPRSSEDDVESSLRRLDELASGLDLRS